VPRQHHFYGSGHLHLITASTYRRARVVGQFGVFRTEQLSSPPRRRGARAPDSRLPFDYAHGPEPVEGRGNDAVMEIGRMARSDPLLERGFSSFRFYRFRVAHTSQSARSKSPSLARTGAKPILSSRLNGGGIAWLRPRSKLALKFLLYFLG